MKLYNFEEIRRQIGRGQSIRFPKLGNWLSSQHRMAALKAKEIRHESVYSLLLSLATLNPSKFLFSFVLFLFLFAIIVSSPFFTNYIIENYLEQQDDTLFSLLALFLLYKIAKSSVGVICNFCYQSLGYEIFARVYWEVLEHYGQLSGKVLNLIEYDCNMLSNLPYSALTALFDSVEIVVIISLFIYYLQAQPYFPLLLGIIILYLASQTLVNYLTYQFTKKYLLKKDRRLGHNINNEAGSAMREERVRELVNNRKFLFSKVISKIITIVFPILITLFIFVLADYSSIQDDIYALLILVNLIKSPVSELLLTLNLLVQISYSCSRIVSFRNGERGQSNSLEEVLSISAPHPLNPESGVQMNQERGGVNWSTIISYCGRKEIVRWMSWALLLALVLLIFLGKFSNYYITKHLISQNYETIDFLGVAGQVVLAVLFYLCLISTTQKISLSLFTEVKEERYNHEYLNRISGDITAIDRSSAISINEIVSSLSFVSCSYLYSIISLNNLEVQIILLAFLGICLALAYKTYRFIMKSRREVARMECLLKADIIAAMAEQEKISSSLRMEVAWRKIFECKEMGLFIENYFLVILNAVLLCFSLALVAACKGLDITPIDRSILLIATLNIDYDLANALLSALRLQICMVSFERVLNALTKN